jgi:hypothetical protein
MAHSETYRRILHKMGYYGYQQGLIHRHLEQGRGWDSHLENSRRFILKAVDLIKPERVTVLGSGWLLDLPLSEIAEKTGSVILCDIVHPPEVIKQAGEIKGVTVMELDATGGLINEVWNKRPGYFLFKRPFSTANITIPEFKPGFEPGLVISLNILSQLDTLPVKFLTERSKIEDRELLDFRRDIQTKQLEFLQRHSSVLITDLKEVFTDRAGNKTEVKSVIIDLPGGKLKESWTWDFDKEGSDYHSKKSVLEVEAILL